MGTRSLTIFKDGTRELCRVYRQFDGYLEGHGKELAELCDLQLVNGYNSDKHVAGIYANGMGCLAAQVIHGLKKGIGGIYIAPAGEDNDWCDYVYVVNNIRDNVHIECRRCGSHEDIVFEGTPQELIEMLAEREKA